MGSKPPRIRVRRAGGAVQSPSSNIGPLPVSALAGLIAAAVALFALVTWLVVILIRRRRRRRKGAVPLKERESRLTEKAHDGQGKITENLEEAIDRSEESAGGKLPFRRLENTTDETKYDPYVSLE
jgi:flagellar biosynthesis/type III secretory pathway M-ring protein FliF/YscJ